MQTPKILFWFVNQCYHSPNQGWKLFLRSALSRDHFSMFLVSLIWFVYFTNYGRVWLCLLGLKWICNLKDCWFLFRLQRSVFITVINMTTVKQTEIVTLYCRDYSSFFFFVLDWEIVTVYCLRWWWSSQELRIQIWVLQKSLFCNWSNNLW